MGCVSNKFDDDEKKNVVEYASPIHEHESIMSELYRHPSEYLGSINLEHIRPSERNSLQLRWENFRRQTQNGLNQLPDLREIKLRKG